MVDPELAEIVYWNRIEPRPRSTSIERALSAEVRDPLWFLTRQWQLGEFQGEDAASPAYIEVSIRHSQVAAMGRGTLTALTSGAPPEHQATTEGSVTPGDLTIVSELAFEFDELARERLLALHTDPEIQILLKYLRSQMPPLSATYDSYFSAPDSRGARWLKVADGRVTNALEVIGPNADFEQLLANVYMDQADVEAVDDSAVKALLLEAAGALATFHQQTYGDIFGAGAPGTWNSERLRYELESGGVRPISGVPVGFKSHVGMDGELEWYSHDEVFGQVPSLPSPLPSVSSIQKYLLPAHVHFRGMPNARFWDFEEAAVDFGDVKVDKRDLARLAAIDFMLTASNDWFIIPAALPVNSLSSIEYLLVRDVFGNLTKIDRAGGSLSPWNLFTTSVVGGQAQDVSDFLFLPATLGGAKQVGASLEDVRFQRDEMANLAWAIEHATTGSTGELLLGHERTYENRDGTPTAPTMPPDPSVPLTYTIQKGVPYHWHPLMPVALPSGGGQVALRLAGILRAANVQPLTTNGRILNEVGANIQLREEEIPRTGTRIRRVMCRSRWSDGSTHIWIERHRSNAEGEANSGLCFDIVQASAANS